MTILNRKERVLVNEWLEVNRDGEGFSVKTGNKLKPEKLRNGYLRFSTRYNNKSVKILAHRAVALAFLPNPNNHPTVNHKDAVKDNNTVENLEWATHQEQQDHVSEMGLRKISYGEDNSSSRYSETLIRAICKDLEDGIRNNVIVDKYQVDVKLPSDIRNKRSWTHISKEYNIGEKARGTIPDEVVHEICVYLEKGFGIKKILNTLNLPEDIISRSKIGHIKKRNTYTHISEKYDW